MLEAYIDSQNIERLNKLKNIIEQSKEKYKEYIEFDFNEYYDAIINFCLCEIIENINDKNKCKSILVDMINNPLLSNKIVHFCR